MRTRWIVVLPSIFSFQEPTIWIRSITIQSHNSFGGHSETDYACHFKKLNQQHGYYLRKRLYKLSSNFKNFLDHIQLRMHLWNINTALLLETEHNLQKESLLQSEKEKLSSTNTIHNFTDINLPPNFIQLLNKGTNFIPTSDKTNPSSIKNTNSSEFNLALSNLIKSSSSQPTLKTRSKKHHRYQPYTTKNTIKLLQEHQTKPNFNVHIIDYVYNTTSYTKHYLHSTNLHTFNKQQHLNITQPLTTYIQNINARNDIILTKTDKNMGWALVPTSWFTDGYNRQLADTTTYKLH